MALGYLFELYTLVSMEELDSIYELSNRLIQMVNNYDIVHYATTHIIQYLSLQE